MKAKAMEWIYNSNRGNKALMTVGATGVAPTNGTGRKREKKGV